MTSKYFKHVSRVLLVAAVVFSCSGVIAPQSSHAEDLLPRVVVRDQAIPTPQYYNTPNVPPGQNGGSVYKTLIAADGTIYLAGNFAFVSGQDRHNLAALSADGTLLSWNPNADGGVYTMAMDGSNIYIGGDFSHIGTTTKNMIAAISTNGQLTSWAPALPEGYAVAGIVVGANSVYVMTSPGPDYYGDPNSAVESVFAFDKASGAKQWSVTTDGFAINGALKDSTLYVSGIFTKLGGQDRSGLGAINVSSGQVTSWNPNPSNAHPEYSYNLVQALTLSGNTLYVGGSFSSIANQSRSYIASFDASTGNLTNWNPQVSFGYVNESPSIMSMAVDGSGKLYVGGSFGDDNHSSFYNLFILDQNGTEYYWPIDMEANADNGYYAPALANVAISGHYMYASSYNDFARYDLNSPVPMTTVKPVYPGPIPPPVVLPPNVHAGQLLKFKSNNAVYLVEPEGLYPFRNYYSFQLYQGASNEKITNINNVIDPYTVTTAYGYSSADEYLGQYIPAGQPYVPGTLVNSKGTVFLIMAGEQIPFRNKESFLGLGYSFADVINADLTNSGLTQTPGIYTDKVPHTWGTWLNYNGTIYYSDETGMIGVPDWSTFLSNHGLPQMIKQMNQYDLDVYFQDPNQPVLRYTDPRVALSPNDPPYDPATYRDQTRVYDIYNIQYALEDYYYANNSQYPATLNDLVPGYIGELPVAPTPADGSCTADQNTYKYVRTDSSNVALTFCLGTAVDKYVAGVNTDHSPTAADHRDITRINDIYQLDSAIENYRYDHSNKYPSALSDLTPAYIGQLPVAPTPADGTCSAQQNTYAYQKLTDTTFKMTFCLGGSYTGYSAGFRTIDQTGQIDGGPVGPTY